MTRLKSIGQAVLRQNFYVTLAYHRIRLRWEGRSRQQKVVIYQMGKVGSTSILEALRVHNIDAHLYHIHFLSSSKLKQDLHNAKNAFPKSRYILPEIVEADYIKAQLTKYPKKAQDWKVITLIRDPIARRVSAFFQITELPRFSKSQWNDSGFINDKVESLQKIFLDSWLNFSAEPFHWFDSELKANFNFDIFAHPFNQEMGYQIYDSDNESKILCLKLEALDHSASKAINEFMGIENFLPKKANVGNQKNYSILYKKFKSTLKLPSDFIEEIYGSDHVKHFYSSQEIDGFRQVWDKK